MKDQDVIKMYTALKRIAKYYQTPDQLRKSSQKDYGLNYIESLKMAYENIQQEAADAIKGIGDKSLLKYLSNGHKQLHKRQKGLPKVPKALQSSS